MNVIRLFAVFLSLYLVSNEGTGQVKKKKTLFVIVDGIAADVLERVNTPYIDMIAKEGAYTRAFLGGEKGGYTETPTISAVGYNSLLTGTWANKHNVWDNDIQSPNYNYWTIFRYMKEQYPEKKTAVFSTWLDNRTKLIGDGLQQTGGWKIDYHYDGLELDTLNFPHQDEFYIQKIDDKVAWQAATVIREEAPDLNWVYLQFPDNTGHDYGDSPENDKAVGVVDRQVGQIFHAVQHREQNYNEEWLVIITTDHGRKALFGKDHGGQSEREKTIWVSTNHNNLNTYFYSSRPAIVDILPSIADFMGIDIPRKQQFELDGVSLVGDISISHPEAQMVGEELLVFWEAYHKDGKVKIWLAETNHFNASGKEDHYFLAGETDILKEAYRIPLQDDKGKFFKVVIEGKHNSLNRWVIR